MDFSRDRYTRFCVGIQPPLLADGKPAAGHSPLRQVETKDLPVRVLSSRVLAMAERP
jgi:hypothetical protein